MTKRKIARNPKQRTKRGEAPIPFTPIERAAQRAGIKPATSPDWPDGYAPTPEDEAIIAKLNETGLRSSRFGELIVEMRSQGHENDTIRRRLFHEAAMLENFAQRLRPEQATRDAMLVDALEVVEAAEATFYLNGVHGSTPEAIMAEALDSMDQDLGGLSERLESSDTGPEWQELLRARYRITLARKLAAFREKHGVYVPTKKDAEQGEKAVAS